MVNVLIMHSTDGIGWTRVALYPPEWTQIKADREYLEALKEAQVGEEWQWDDIEAAMVRRGFIAAYWHVADYAWDEIAANITDGN